MKYKKITISLFLITILLIMQFSVICLPANAAPTRPTLCDIPKNNQIVPRNDVVLRWNDSPNEAYYYMSIRNLDTNVLLYSNFIVPQNATSFTVPRNMLTYDTEYRWCVAAVDSSGTYKCADAVIFHTEKYRTSNEELGLIIAKNDPHLYGGGFASASNIEYFVYATSTYNSVSYDSILNSAAQSWNGISANVKLTRTATPSDGKYEMGIFQTPSPTDDRFAFGTTIPKIGGSSGTAVSSYVTCDYAEIRTYSENIYNFYNNDLDDSYVFYIRDCNTYLKANAMHEIGHALSLIHTDVYDYAINETKVTYDSVPLIMNQWSRLSNRITDADKSHLKLKWG